MNLPKNTICDGCSNKKPGEPHQCQKEMIVIDGLRTKFRCDCHVCQNWEHPTSTAGMLEEAFNLIGHSMMKEDFAAKLLAYTYVFGSELTILHDGVRSGIMIAQEKFRIKGGHVPDARGVMLIRQYIQELEGAAREPKPFKDGHKGFIEHTENEWLLPRCPWLQEIFDRYELETIASVRKPKKHKKHEDQEQVSTIHPQTD